MDSSAERSQNQESRVSSERRDSRKKGNKFNEIKARRSTKEKEAYQERYKQRKHAKTKRKNPQDYGCCAVH